MAAPGWRYTNRIGFDFRAGALDEASRLTRLMLKAAEKAAKDAGYDVALDLVRTDSHPDNFARKESSDVPHR